MSRSARSTRLGRRCQLGQTGHQLHLDLIASRFVRLSSIRRLCLLCHRRGRKRRRTPRQTRMLQSDPRAHRAGISMVLCASRAPLAYPQGHSHARRHLFRLGHKRDRTSLLLRSRQVRRQRPNSLRSQRVRQWHRRHENQRWLWALETRRWKDHQCLQHDLARCKRLMTLHRLSQLALALTLLLYKHRSRR